MHPSNCPSYGFIHFKNTDWASTTCQTLCLVGANVKDTCPTLREFPMEAVSITHKQRLSAALLRPSDQVATLGSPPRLGWEDVWGQGKHTSWGWKHLGVSSDIRTGKKALSWDLDSIPLDLLGGGWSSGWMGVWGTGEAALSPLCLSSFFLGPPAVLWTATWSGEQVVLPEMFWWC